MTDCSWETKDSSNGQLWLEDSHWPCQTIFRSQDSLGSFYPTHLPSLIQQDGPTPWSHGYPSVTRPLPPFLSHSCFLQQNSDAFNPILVILASASWTCSVTVLWWWANMLTPEILRHTCLLRLVLALCHPHEKDMLCPWFQEEDERFVEGLSHSSLPIWGLLRSTDSQLTPRQVSKSWQNQLSPAQSSLTLQIPELNTCSLLYVNIKRHLLLSITVSI